MTTVKLTVDTSAFDSLIDEFEEEFEDAAEELLTDVFVEMMRRVPVDTGHLRNTHQLDISDRKNPEIYTTCPYAQAIEDGHSPKAPNGYIGVSILAVTSK